MRICRHVCILICAVLTGRVAYRIITSGMQDLERWKVQSGMLGMMVEWKLSKLIPGIAVGVPFTGVPGG